MLNCIAVDDEALALSLLADNISKVPYLKLVASCRNAFDAIRALQENEVDLIFVDIQMPGLTGFAVYRKFIKKAHGDFCNCLQGFCSRGVFIGGDRLSVKTCSYGEISQGMRSGAAASSIEERNTKDCLRTARLFFL
jgi:hypothetical protein